MNCPTCGTEDLEWKDQNGTMVLADEDGVEHVCARRLPRMRARVEKPPDPPRLMEHEDMQRFTREVARLATSVELMAQELREWRQTASAFRLEMQRIRSEENERRAAQQAHPRD